VVFHERATGVVFTGDLLVSTGATALMTQENPWELVGSLRRVADLEPRLLLSGHGLRLEDPADRLRLKADRVEKAATKAVTLHREGLSDLEISRIVFRGHWLRERWGQWLTQGEFSRLNFVRAAREHQP
jgi:glyoxylase-like metal-dependent hydrolase (beta-lactamase superfamily II)